MCPWQANKGAARPEFDKLISRPTSWKLRGTRPIYEMSMLKYLGLVSLLGFALAQPMGWNSYDSFNWFIDEDTFLEQCQAVADTLLPHGYDHCVLDYLWYQSDVLQIDDPLDFGAWTLDQNCLPYPDPKRWPSAADGSGLKAIADKGETVRETKRYAGIFVVLMFVVLTLSTIRFAHCSARDGAQVWSSYYAGNKHLRSRERLRASGG